MSDENGPVKFDKGDGTESPKVAMPKGLSRDELKKQVRELNAELKALAQSVSKAVPRNGNVQRIIKKYL